MLRRLAITLLICPVFIYGQNAQLLPDVIGEFRKFDQRTVAISDKPVWAEYGLEAAEQVVYSSGKKEWTLTGYRLKDSTSAMAAFQWQRPADSKPSPVEKMAAETPGGGAILQFGNYLLVFDNHKPEHAELQRIFLTLPRFEQSPLPTLLNFLPERNRVANSERFISGPASLAKFRPGLSLSTVAFNYGTEGQVARYQTSAGAMDLAIFYYPTPQIAMERVTEFQKVSGAVAKRAGPMVAVILSPANADEAQRLLANVSWQPEVTRNERVPSPEENPGTMLLSIFVLAGILIAASIIMGLFFGGFRQLMRRLRGDESVDEPMIMLNLTGRSRGI